MKPIRPVTSDEKHIRRIFALVQGQAPRRETLERKVGQTLTKTLDQAFYSIHVAEKVLPRFIGGSDQPDRHQSLGLTEGAVTWAARRVRAKYERSSAVPVDEDAVPDGPPNDGGKEGAFPLTWRHAFRSFFVELGPWRAEVLGRLERQSSDGAPNVIEMAAALDALDEVDALNEAGRAAEAFALTRRQLAAGRTCFASRHLAIAAAIAPDPGGVEPLIKRYGDVVSRRLGRQLQRAAAARLDASLGGGADAGATAFNGELPTPYAVDVVPARSGFDPGAATLWAALTRTGPLRTGPPGDEVGVRRQVRPIAVLRADADPSAENVATAIGMADDGIALVLVAPASDDLRERLADRADITVVEGFAEARALLATSPEAASALVCDAFAPVPRAVFEVIRSAGAEPGPIPVNVMTVPRSSAPSDIGGIAGASSRPAGLWAASGRALCAPLERAADRPAEAAVSVEMGGPTGEDERRPLPVQVYALGPSGLPEIPLPLVEVVLGGRDEHVALPEDAVIPPAAATAAEVGAILRGSAADRGLPPGTPVVFRIPGISYDPAYARMLATQYLRDAGRLPIAVRGLSVGKEGRLEFDDGERSVGLLRTAPIGLTCLSLGAASVILASGGDQPADGIVVRFDPAAAVCTGAMPLVRTTWRGVLSRIARDQEAVQGVFEHGRRDLAAEIAGGFNAGRGRGSVHLEGYLRNQDAARRRMDAVLKRDIAQPSQHLSRLLTSDAPWSLVADGHGAEVRAALLALAERPADLLEIAPSDFKTLLELVEACGAQEAFATALAPLAPEFCDRDPFFIRALFRLLAASLDGTVVASMLLASIAAEVGGKRRTRHLGRLGVQVAELCGPETVVIAYRYLDRALEALSDQSPDIPAAFARRVLSAPAVSLDADQLDRLTAAASPETRLSLAVADGDRDRAKAALTEMADRDGHLRASIEASRLDGASMRRLRLGAAEWRYMAYGDVDDILAMAAILGDTDTITAYLGQAVDAEIAAAAAAVTGDHALLDAVYREWAVSERIAPVTFRGSSIAEVFASVIDTVPASDPSIAGGSAELVSVIVTAHDPDPALLRLSLASISAQSWPDLEILLVDDGSGLHGREAIREAAQADPRIRILEMPRNGGPYLSRNLALETARGTLIAIQDADDASHPDRFACQVLNLSRAPRALATEAGHMRLDEGGRPQFLRDMRLVDDGTMSTMYRREAFERLGPFAATRSRGDVEMRERIRQAFGPAAFQQMACPLVFCLGAGSTHSRRIVQDHEGVLKRFRSAFLSRAWRRGDAGPEPIGPLVVPPTLRP